MNLVDRYDAYIKSRWGRSNGVPINAQAQPTVPSSRRINTIQNQYGDTMSRHLLPSLPTTQLEETQGLKQAANGDGGHIEFPPSDIDFLPSLKIPKGFKLSEDTSKYRLLLSMDQHNLRIVREEIKKEATVILEDEQGNPVTMKTEVKLFKFTLVGEVYYNLVITGFEPKDPMFGKKEAVFSTDPAIPINMILGYSNNASEPVLNEFVITVNQGVETIVTATGERIDRNNPLFFQILQEGNQELTFESPDTATVAPGPAPIC